MSADEVMVDEGAGGEVGDCASSADVEGKFTFFSCPIAESSLQAMTPGQQFNMPGPIKGIPMAAQPMNGLGLDLVDLCGSQLQFQTVGCSAQI